MKRARWALAMLVACVAIALLLKREPDVAVPPERSVAPETAGGAPPQFEAQESPPGPVPVAVATPEAQADAPAAGTGTVLIVRHADGTPARGDVVALVAGDEVKWSKVSDEAGQVQGPAVAGAAVAWVGGATPAPASFALDDARGRHELVLPAGEVIDGRIVVDGGPPPEPVPLWLTPAADSKLPDAVRRALTPWTFGTPRLEYGDEADFAALVGGDGTFRFSGLPAAWEGRLNVPYTWIPDHEGDLAVRTPEHDLLLRLRRIPHLRFRVVTGADSAPVPFAIAGVKRSGVGSSNEDSFACDADGRGDVPMLRWEPTLQVTLDLANPEGTSRVVVQQDLKDSSHDVDLGDIALLSRVSIAFRVTGPDGSPIAGAVAATECETLIRSGITDADGEGLLNGVTPGCTEMRVGAARHEPVRVELPPQPPPVPIAVTLAPCAWLSLRVRSEDGAPRPALTLQLETSRHVTAEDGASSFFGEALEMGVHVESGPSSRSGTETERQPDGSLVQKRTMSARLWKFGDFELGCMEPGQRVSLSLEDDAQTVLWSDEVVLKPGEQRQLEAVVAAHSHPVDVFVTDESGVPVEAASAQVRVTGSDAGWPAGSSRPVSTDAAGHASFAAVYTPSVDVLCEKDGYLTGTLTGVVPGVPGHLTLRHGLGVTVHCVDGKGRPVIVEGIWIVQGPTTVNGDPVDPQPDENGRRNRSSVYQFEGVAPGSMSVQVQAGGREFSSAHDSSEADVSIVLPESGGLVVRGLQAAKGVDQTYLRVGLQGEEKLFLLGWIGLGEIARDELSWPVVFPGRYRVELVAGEDKHLLAGPAFIDVHVGEVAELSLH